MPSSKEIAPDSASTGSRNMDLKRKHSPEIKQDDDQEVMSLMKASTDANVQYLYSMAIENRAEVSRRQTELQQLRSKKLKAEKLLIYLYENPDMEEFINLTDTSIRKADQTVVSEAVDGETRKTTKKALKEAAQKAAAQNAAAQKEATLKEPAQKAAVQKAATLKEPAQKAAEQNATDQTATDQTAAACKEVAQGIPDYGEARKVTAQTAEAQKQDAQKAEAQKQAAQKAEALKATAQAAQKQKEAASKEAAQKEAARNVTARKAIPRKAPTQKPARQNATDTALQKAAAPVQKAVEAAHNSEQRGSRAQKAGHIPNALGTEPRKVEHNQKKRKVEHQPDHVVNESGNESSDSHSHTEEQGRSSDDQAGSDDQVDASVTGDEEDGDEEDATGDEVDEVVGAVVEDIRDKYKYRA